MQNCIQIVTNRNITSLIIFTKCTCRDKQVYLCFVEDIKSTYWLTTYGWRPTLRTWLYLSSKWDPHDATASDKVPLYQHNLVFHRLTNYPRYLHFTKHKGGVGSSRDIGHERISLWHNKQCEHLFIYNYIADVVNCCSLVVLGVNMLRFLLLKAFI